MKMATTRIKKVVVDGSGESGHNNARRKKRLVIRKPVFGDVRCSCGALLYREMRKSDDAIERVIEIKCRKCGTVKVS